MVLQLTVVMAAIVRICGSKRDTWTGHEQARRDKRRRAGNAKQDA